MTGAVIAVSNPSDIALLREVVVGPCKPVGQWALMREHFRWSDLVGLRHLLANRVEVPRHPRALAQHRAFVALLRAEAVVVHELGTLPDVALQLYPRDIAFAVDDVLFLARPGTPARQREQRALDPLLPRIARVERLDAGRIEGGDVIVTDREVLVGLSEATDRTGIAALERGFARAGIAREIVPVGFARRGVIHLDTKFTLVGPGLGYAHLAAFDAAARRHLTARFELIEASAAETRDLMVNTLALAPDRIAIDARAARLAVALTAHGITPVPVDCDEIVKLPGGLRCATLPLRRH